jgi:hypothetical protein
MTTKIKDVVGVFTVKGKRYFKPAHLPQVYELDTGEETMLGCDYWDELHEIEVEQMSKRPMGIRS